MITVHSLILIVMALILMLSAEYVVRLMIVWMPVSDGWRRLSEKGGVVYAGAIVHCCCAPTELQMFLPRSSLEIFFCTFEPSLVVPRHVIKPSAVAYERSTTCHIHTRLAAYLIFLSF